MADRLGMAIRDPANPADLGTTILVVEPTVEAPDLVAATERYWWPALHEPSFHFDVSVMDEAGQVHYPRPKSSADLRPFIGAYEVATTPQDSRRPEVKRQVLRRISAYETPGALGMVAENPGWSYPEFSEGETGVDHKSLVALVRKPRMVVEYYEAGRTQPYVRGTFVADDLINDPLRLTEPKAHDAWQGTTASGDIRDDHAEVAKAVLSRIRTAVRRFQDELKPQPRPAEQLRLSEFDRIMRALLQGGGSGKRPPSSERRPFSIRPGGRLEVAVGERLYLTGTATVEFSEHHVPTSDEGDEIEVSVRYRFLEEDRPRGDAEIAIEAPSGFKRVAGRSDTYRGRLVPGAVARFTYMTEEYDASWTGKLFVDAELADLDEAVAEQGGGV